MFTSLPLTYLSLFSLTCMAAAQQCALQFDGRVPAGTQLSAFDSKNGIFNPDNVFGKNLSLSRLLLLPDVGPSLFAANTIPVEVTISDESIFAPSADNVQLGFRRAELLPASNNGTDTSTIGVKTLHFSLMKDTSRLFNLSHEYQLAFLESADFSTNQFVVKTGTLLDRSTPTPDSLMLFGNVKDNGGQLLFSTNFAEGVFHNFGVKLDFAAKTTQIFYSTGTDPLAQKTEPLPNDVSGQGQFHFGILKKGLNGGADITKDAFQPKGINEGIIYTDIFMEDSSNNCTSLSPTDKGKPTKRRAVAARQPRSPVLGARGKAQYHRRMWV